MSSPEERDEAKEDVHDTQQRGKKQPVLPVDKSAPRPVHAILFDKDGTLFDFRLTWLPIIREAALRISRGDQALADRLLNAAGYDPHADRFSPDGPIAAGTSDDIAASWVSLLPSELQRELLALAPGTKGNISAAPSGGESGVDDRSVPGLRSLLDQNSLTLGPQNSVPVCDLPSLFDTLRGAGLRIGLATSDTERAARATLQLFSVLDSFDWISGYDSGTGRKPSAEIVYRFARHVAADCQSILVVGDTLHDLNMARAAGAMSAAVLTGAVARDELEPHADVVLQSIADLPRLLGISCGLPPALRV